jgi:CheY-like chemotaxis protein
MQTSSLTALDDHLDVRTKLEPALSSVETARVILLVEDNPGDIRLVREVFSRGTIPLRLFVAQDGLEAITLLQRSGRRPDLILLDLNLPGLDGRAVLRRIKTTPDLMQIPVIVLTSSSAPQDVWSAYDLRANCYIVKPGDFGVFERTLRRLVEFWAEIVHLPSAGPS